MASFRISQKTLNTLNQTANSYTKLIAERLSLSVGPSTTSRMEILKNTYNSIKDKTITQQLYTLHKSRPEQLSTDIANFLRKDATENKESAEYILSLFLTRFEKKTKIDTSGTDFLIKETNKGIEAGLSTTEIKEKTESVLFQLSVSSGSTTELELSTLDPKEHNKFSQTEEHKLPKTLKNLNNLLKYCRDNV